MRHDTPALLARVTALALGVVALDPLDAWQAPGPARGPGGLEAAVAAVEAGRTTTPLVDQPAEAGNATVTFLARASGGRAPRIVSDVTGWGEHLDGTFDFTVGAMTRVGTSDWYSLQATVAPRARIEYLIAYGEKDYQLDPHNPRRLEAPEASELVTPDYQPPPELADPATPLSGAFTDHTIQSLALGTSCGLAVYTPSAARQADDAAVAVLFDPGPARRLEVGRVIDRLVARQAIEPIVAVFLSPGPRAEAALAAGPIHELLTTELARWLSSRPGLTHDGGRRAIIGISFSAKDALDAALAGAFGRLGLLIPGRRIGRADLDTIPARGHGRLQVSILAGRYDQANVATARGLRQALAAAGHEVDYVEVPEGHSPRTWLGHMRDVLVSLFGPDSPGLRRRRPPQVSTSRSLSVPGLRRQG